MLVPALRALSRMAPRVALVAAGLALTGPALAAPPSMTAAPTAPGATAPAQQHLDSLRVAHPGLRATFRPGAALPSLVTGLAEPTTGATPTARVTDFITRHPALFAGVELTPVAVKQRPDRTLVQLEQRHAGLRVLDRSASVTLDAAGRVIRTTGDAQPIKRFDRATISAEQARSLAIRAVFHLGPDAPLPAIDAPVERGVVVVGTRGTEVLEVGLTRRALHESLVVRVDAHAGRIVSVRNLVRH